MSTTRRSMLDLTEEIRDDVDEPLDATGTTNFWTQDMLVLRINRGLRQVWQLARNDKGARWFVRTMRSTDPVTSIHGRPFNPACLQVTDGADELVLPPDFGELLLFEPIVSATDGSTADITFRYTPINSPTFRALSRTASGFSEYWCDVIQRLNGPRLVLRPPFQATTLDTVMEYLVKPNNYALTDTFEGLGFDDLMLDAVIAYAVMDCYRKADAPDKLKAAEATWSERRALVIEAVGPLQTVEHEVVQGFIPDGDER
jgi:hypothetical protein